MTKMTVPILKAIHGDRLELGKGQPVAGQHVYRAWQRRRDSDGIDWLILDAPDAAANLVDNAMLEELNTLLAEIESDKPRGVVIRSAKPGGFIAGADVQQFRGAVDAAAVAAQLARAHQIVDRLAALPTPTVAVIHGFCLGGGLEIALACHTRLCTPDASLGFPEVQLGLHPGLGGTARLTRLINPLDAMTMMLTGKRKFARAALAAGLVDGVVEERHVAAAVTAAVKGDVTSRRKSWPVMFYNLAPVRWLAAMRMRREASRRARPAHYPAPYALIDLWQQRGGTVLALKQAEIQSFGRLVIGETAQNLIRIFFLRQKMRDLGKDGRKIYQVHVVGAGAMGCDIAAWCALRGFRVSLADTNSKALAKAMARASALFARETHSSSDCRDAADRFVLDAKGAGVANADLVIEAVPEKRELKRKVHAAIEANLAPHAILATNTSSLKLEELREGLRYPDRFIGLHFFNPVPKMQLVEVVSHDGTAADVAATARRFVADLDRLPAPVKSAPGFLVNRALMPYLLEALVLLDEKVSPDFIDGAAEQFGMPMGPLALADEVGLDICLDVARVLKANLSQPFPDLPAWFEEKVKKGELGKKTGKGFYAYVDGKRQNPTSPHPASPSKVDGQLIERLILPLLNACAACLREGVVADEDAADGALVFGAGFAPFRGGPMHYARQRGFSDIKASLARLQAALGDRFAPDPFWNGEGEF